MTRGESRGRAMALIDDWTQYLTALGQSPSTIRTYGNTIKAAARQAGVSPEHLQRQHLIAFLGRPDLKPWTRSTYWNALRAWGRYLIEFGHRADDLTKGIPRPKSPDPVARPITDEAVSLLLSAKLSPRAHAYVRLALFAGLRVHEIAHLRAEDFDLAAGWLIVTGKGGRSAPVPIHAELVKLAERMPQTSWWFPSYTDPTRPVCAGAVSTTIKAALRMVGSTATAHQLRDTYATRVQRQCKDLRVTQTLLRHRSVRSTQKYTGVSDDDMQAAMLALDWAKRVA